MKTPGKGPVLSPRARAEEARRKERLAAALRDNLRKRKEQQRERAEPDPPPDGEGA